MTRQQTRKRVAQWAALGAVGAVALGLSGWGMHALHASETAAPAAASPVLRHEGARLVVPPGSALRSSVQVAPVTRGDVDVPFTLPAVVEAEPGRVAKVLTPLTGRIVSVNKHLGDTVKAGDILLTIDAPDLAQAAADAARADAALVLAKRNLERQVALDAADIASKRDLEQARNDASQAASEVTRASARLLQLGARPGAEPVLAVRAPIAGRVVELVATAGGYWTDATAPLMTVADLAHVYVTASAQEKDLAQLREGQDVSVAFDAWPEPVRARVGMLDWMVDPDTRTLKVRIPLDNRAARLRPGMFARVSFVAPPRKGLMVPAAAVVQVGLAARVFVEVAPWQFAPRTVTLGAQAGNQVEVLAGLAPGERIVVKDGVLLND